MSVLPEWITISGYAWPSRMRVARWPMIPRMIHQIWVGDIAPTAMQCDQIADIARKVQKEGFEYRFWSNSNYPADVPDNVKAYAKACRHYTTNEMNYGAFEADALRYLIMYQYVGVYLDCDYNVVRPLSELVNQFDDRPVFARRWPQRRAWPTNAFLAAPPNHAFYKCVVASIGSAAIRKPYYIGPAWFGARLSAFLNEPIANCDNDVLSSKGCVRFVDEGDMLLRHRHNPSGYLEHRAWHTWAKRLRCVK